VAAAALVALYAVVWWVIASAASRRHGAAVFALGLLLLAGAWRAHRRGRAQWLLRLSYASLLAAAAALMLEAALHLRPSLLGGPVANFAYSGYHPYRGGIYSLDAHLGQLMRPNVRRWMYWNGHWWRHVSNAQGWRGAALERADVVFLGDSMVYGHGVQEDETVPARFAHAAALATANLGQQGTCAVQQLMLLRRRGRALRPRVVFLCVHPTDVEDLERMYEPPELTRMVDHPDQEPLIRAEYGPPPRWDPLWLWARHVELPLRSGGILGTLLRVARVPALRERGTPRDPFVPTPAEIEETLPALRADAPAPLLLARRAHRASLREVRAECDRLGARLVLFDLGYPRGFSADTEALAAELGVEYSPAGRVAVRRAQEGERVYLADDGHWSARGAEIVAQELARTATVQAIR
jgi:hypothetical protein